MSFNQMVMAFMAAIMMMVVIWILAIVITDWIRDRRHRREQEPFLLTQVAGENPTSTPATQGQGLIATGLIILAAIVAWISLPLGTWFIFEVLLWGVFVAGTIFFIATGIFTVIDPPAWCVRRPIGFRPSIQGHLERWPQPLSTAARVLFETNNQRLAMLCSITAVTFVIACFNLGDPLATSTWQSAKAAWNENVGENTIHNGWWVVMHGNEVDPTTVRDVVIQSPSKPEAPPTPKTWHWPKMFWVYFFITLCYTPVAFSDEFAAAWRAAHERNANERQEPARQQQSAAPQPQQTGGATLPGSMRDGRLTLWQFFARFLPLEIIGDFVADLIPRIFARIFGSFRRS